MRIKRDEENVQFFFQELGTNIWKNIKGWFLMFSTRYTNLGVYSLTQITNSHCISCSLKDKTRIIKSIKVFVCPLRS